MAGDVDADGYAELVFGGGPGGAARVPVLSGRHLIGQAGPGAFPFTELANFFVAGNSTDRGRVRVAVADLDGDKQADVVSGSGEGRPAAMRVCLGRTFDPPSLGEPAAPQDVTLFGGVTLTDGVFVG